MKHIFESLASTNLRIKIAKLFHPEANNSFNNTEVHFHNPVIFINKQTKGIKERLKSSLMVRKSNN